MSFAFGAFLLALVGCGEPRTTVRSDASEPSESARAAEPVQEEPSLLDFSDIGLAETFGYQIENVDQLRDIVSLTALARLDAIRPGISPAEDLGISPGTFLADFAVIEALGGRLPPVRAPDGPSRRITVAIRLDVAPGDVEGAIDALERHIGERYLLFLTPEHVRGTGRPSGRYALAPYAWAPLLQVQNGRLAGVSRAEVPLRDAIARGEARTGVPDPAASDPVSESDLQSELRSTPVGTLVGLTEDEARERLKASFGRGAAEVGIPGDQRLIGVELQRNSDMGPGEMFDWR